MRLLFSLPLLPLLLWITFTLLLHSCTAEDYGREFVEEVLTDDAEHYNNDHHASVADEMGQQQEQQQTAEEERKRIMLEREAEQREREFELKLSRMRDDDARKAALRKKKTDARRVRRVLQAQKEGNLYGVLGLLNNRFLRIPGQHVTIVPKYLVFDLPEVNFLFKTDQDIKRAFREMAKQVHPDKNSDGRAVQAFWAVEQAAEVLLDPERRAAYDRTVQARRRAARQKVRHVAQQGVEQVYGVGKQGVGIVRTLLGPFAVPVSILCVLAF